MGQQAGLPDDQPEEPGEEPQHFGELGRVLVVIPTYNERANLASIVGRLHATLPGVHALVVDDNSPDGTGELADELAANDERVHVLHREGKAGLGVAYGAGFEWALARDYGVIVEMDADGSHSPEDLPRLLDALTGPGGADVALGSRYVPGGSVVNWPKRRELLSRGANLYARLALGSGINDITGGFRAYRRAVLETVKLDDVASQGYCFQVDLAWRTVRAGFGVVEVPITFTDRDLGESKMSGDIVREAFWRVSQWGLRHRWRQLRGLRPGSGATRDGSPQVPRQGTHDEAAAP